MTAYIAIFNDLCYNKYIKEKDTQERKNDFQKPIHTLTHMTLHHEEQEDPRAAAWEGFNDQTEADDEPDNDISEMLSHHNAAMTDLLPDNTNEQVIRETLFINLQREHIPALNILLAHYQTLIEKTDAYGAQTGIYGKAIIGRLMGGMVDKEIIRKSIKGESKEGKIIEGPKNGFAFSQEIFEKTWETVIACNEQGIILE